MDICYVSGVNGKVLWLEDNIYIVTTSSILLADTSISLSGCVNFRNILTVKAVVVLTTGEEEVQVGVSYNSVKFDTLTKVNTKSQVYTKLLRALSNESVFTSVISHDLYYVTYYFVLPHVEVV